MISFTGRGQNQFQQLDQLAGSIRAFCSWFLPGSAPSPRCPGRPRRPSCCASGRRRPSLWCALRRRRRTRRSWTSSPYAMHLRMHQHELPREIKLNGGVSLELRADWHGWRWRREGACCSCRGPRVLDDDTEEPERQTTTSKRQLDLTEQTQWW